MSTSNNQSDQNYCTNYPTADGDYVISLNLVRANLPEHLDAQVVAAIKQIAAIRSAELGQNRLVSIRANFSSTNTPEGRARIVASICKSVDGIVSHRLNTVSQARAR